VDPGLKIAGVTTSPPVIPEIFNRESTFLIFPLVFFNTMDPGLKIAGVTNKGNRIIQE